MQIPQGMIAFNESFVAGEAGRDLNGHGTHVAGIISARANNRIGVAGICQCRLMICKALDKEGNSDEGYYRALERAVSRGAQVISLSLGGFGSDPTEEILIRRAIDRQIAVVAAMGNEYDEGNPTEYPAAYPGVISVGATDQVDRRATFSNTGRHINLVAPGVSILSTLPTYAVDLTRRDGYARNYDSLDGTSQATPHVTAAAALLLAKHGSLTVARLTRFLERSADKVAGQRKRGPEYGAGRLNILRALSL